MIGILATIPLQKYKNETAYTGSHTLLCEVRNSRGNIIAANTLIVNVE